jgi:hypothetical protein
VIRLDKINLPVFAIGAGVIHAVGLAVLLPLLITLPGPGSDIDPQAVTVDVAIVPASPPSPKVEPEVEQTSALPDSPPTADPPAKDAPATEPDESPSAVADVGPETSPSSMPAAGQTFAPAAEGPAATAGPAKRTKAKVEGKGAKPAKVVRAAAPKKPVLARAKPAKPLFRRSAKDLAKGPAPFKGSWSALLGGPPPSPAVKTQN